MMDNRQASLLQRLLEKSQQKQPPVFSKRRRKRRYPPASEEQVRATEEALGFALPSLLRACYLHVSNGGFGPGEGVMGVIGGFKENRGNIVEAYRWRKRYYQPIDLASCERQASENPITNLPFHVVSSKMIEPPDMTWPESLLEFYHHGCATFSCLDVETGRIFVGGDPFLWYEANSLEEWLERWLRGDWAVHAPSGNRGYGNAVDPFLPQWPDSGSVQ